MHLNKRHPGFSMEMELLASLPQEPYGAPIGALVADLDQDDQEDVRDLIVSLRDYGYAIGTRRGEDGNVVFVRSDGWKKARKDAEAYWQQVNAAPEPIAV